MMVWCMVFTLAVQICLCGVIYNQSKQIDQMTEILGMQDSINKMHFESTQILKDRIDAVALISEDSVKKHDSLKTKIDLAEVQILNLNNKTALQSTAIRKLQDRCLEVG